MSTSVVYLKKDYKAEVNNGTDKSDGESAGVNVSSRDIHNFFTNDLKWSMLLWEIIRKIV